MTPEQPERWGIVITAWPPVSDMGPEMVGPFWSLEDAQRWVETTKNVVWSASVLIPPAVMEREARRV